MNSHGFIPAAQCEPGLKEHFQKSVPKNVWSNSSWKSALFIQHCLEIYVCLLLGAQVPFWQFHH
ncbi:hypothetical protein AB205_0104650 [Aquarana catesbeiana]|uniref:Uncharacterized protein n=1 Tax=Aquarana catesbeiana TaxID=8400 RepID=A0A2G9S202_AQUCT|nr:hypothetical protein AB205_0104650 [Aquarana catesbeiana]